MKCFYVDEMSGRRQRYLLRFHNGESAHSDGSPFFDLRTFTSKVQLAAAIRELRNAGYVDKPRFFGCSFKFYAEQQHFPWRDATVEASTWSDAHGKAFRELGSDRVLVVIDYSYSVEEMSQIQSMLRAAQ